MMHEERPKKKNSLGNPRKNLEEFPLKCIWSFIWKQRNLNGNLDFKDSLC